VSVCYDLTVVYECIVGVSEEEWLALPDEQREERFSDLVSEVAEKLYYDHDEPSACEDEDSLLMRIDIYYDDHARPRRDGVVGQASIRRCREGGAAADD
jgi:hypothetical protein